MKRETESTHVFLVEENDAWIHEAASLLQDLVGKGPCVRDWCVIEGRHLWNRLRSCSRSG